MWVRKRTEMVEARQFHGDIAFIDGGVDRWVPDRIDDIEMAEWCGGYIERHHLTEEDGKASLFLGDGDGDMAWAGWWVVRHKNRFVAYSPDSFHEIFEAVD